MKPHIADFLKFLESKENKKVPLVAKLLHPNKFNPLTEEDLNIEGSLNLSYTGVDYLPDNLTVKGDLDLTYTGVDYLPDNLTVEGDLYVWDLRISSLPNNLKIGKHLNISGTPLAVRMTEEEIRQKIKDKGGYVKGLIGLW